ncbi:MAG: PE domain-containing protein [Mycobacterium sp.]|nr:PE domain-containing protein [Mycobacterium gordonae]MBI2701599.1 PE domain-containing protein [Mycobacterium sp.]PJE06936.1 MAG: PE domain-containing protein [Mycobacterium sp.]
MTRSARTVAPRASRPRTCRRHHRRYGTGRARGADDDSAGIAHLFSGPAQEYRAAAGQAAVSARGLSGVNTG